MAGKAKAVAKQQGQLMTVRDVATLLGVTEWVVYDMARTNRIPHRRMGRGVRFTRPEIDRWLQGEPQVAEQAS